MIRVIQLIRFVSKTCRYIFDYNLIKNCPITTIVGKLVAQTIAHRKLFFFNLTYFVHTFYVNKPLNLKIVNVQIADFPSTFSLPRYHINRASTVE